MHETIKEPNKKELTPLFVEDVSTKRSWYKKRREINTINMRQRAKQMTLTFCSIEFKPPQKAVDQIKW